MNIALIKKLKSNHLIISISLILLLYVLLRAARLSFTFDESFSYINYVHAPLLNTFIYFNPNNHFLNSILMRICEILFGHSELSLRLPNVISFIFFLYYTYLILKKLVKEILILPLFCFITFNPYLLQYFSLARGYGLSISLMMISIYFFLEFFDNLGKREHLFLTTLFGALSVLANLTSLNFFLSLLILILILLFHKRFIIEKQKINFNNIYDSVVNKDTLIIFINSVILFLLLAIPVFLMKLKNQFYFGGTSGFWKDTVKSLINYSFYFEKYNNFVFIIVQIFIVVFFVLASIVLIKEIYKKRLNYNVLIIALFFLTIISSIAQNYLIKTRFLIERTALFFIPLFFLSVAIVLNYLFSISNYKYSLFIKIVISIMFAVLLYNLIVNLNLYKTAEWQYDADTKNATQAMSGLTFKTLCSENNLLPTLNYYKIAGTLNNDITIVDYKTFNGHCDLYFLNLQYNNIDRITFPTINIIRTFSESNNVLFTAKN